MTDATRSPAARCGTYPAVQREQPVTLADALTAVEELAHALAEIARCQSAAACPQCRQLARDVVSQNVAARDGDPRPRLTAHGVRSLDAICRGLP